ncbi:uncharacterized protein BYT42DRAFT_577946 [Radiomyces spectabilis]|uniref:uncharacterized protein n=1 Tax=Radiomyces spectabilis TaxID=64574 RepID=UPI0022210674|nr:uncharacterized protein BYT42DRAFT_577946 [Radiomyces spectabilis]KAI8372775.1 hypothetical protein BYT42DRAFT_577946 [Radiomyces spectabilis]
MSSFLSWRLTKWVRILAYALLFIVSYHLFTRFTQPSTPSAPLVPSSTHETLGFPWYRQPHPHASHVNPYAQLNLTSSDRRALQEKAVQKAHDLIQEPWGETIKGLPGTKFTTQDAADAFRAQVDCWTRGQWIQHDASSMLPHFQDPVYGSCDRAFYKRHSSNEKRPALRYTWQPECALPHQLDRSQWCDAFKGRNILMVGDLVHFQLHDLFLDTLRDGPVVCFGELNCKDHSLCSKPDVNLRYLRNDVLSTVHRVDKAHGRPHMDIVEWPFLPGYIISKYDILILNRGPVAEDDGTFTRQLINTMRTIRRVKPHALVIYRSTSIGHPYCDEADRPLKKPLTDEERRQLPFGWSEVQRRNAIARSIVEASGGLFVDLAAVTDLRPDGHVGGQDCLRYCMPGPLDSWVHILYNVFVSL